jgi:hypothetical protein
MGRPRNRLLTAKQGRDAIYRPKEENHNEI